MSAKEMEDALDKLEKDGLTLASLDNVPPVVNDDDPPPADPPADPPPDDNDDDPPGYLNYEQWVAAGKNPDDFKGKNAYVETYDRNKGLEAKVDGLVETVQQMNQATNTLRVNDAKKIRDGLIDELNVAREAGETDKALLAQNKINNFDAQNKGTAPVLQENPVIETFRKKNPILDSKSSRFNSEYNADLQGFYNTILSNMTNNGTQPATDAQVKRALTLAQTDANRMHPDLFESTRNTRGRRNNKVAARKTDKSTDYRAQLKGIGNPKNAADGNAAIDMYDELVKRGGGDKTSADTYAKSVLGE